MPHRGVRTRSRALEQNDQFFRQERNKLGARAEDCIRAAEQALADTRLKLKSLKRLARLEASLTEAKRRQDDIHRVEGEQRCQRQEIFAVEDDIEARRDALIQALGKRLRQASQTRTLLTLRWVILQCVV